MGSILVRPHITKRKLRLQIGTAWGIEVELASSQVSAQYGTPPACTVRLTSHITLSFQLPSSVSGENQGLLSHAREATYLSHMSPWERTAMR